MLIKASETDESPLNFYPLFLFSVVLPVCNFLAESLSVAIKAISPLSVSLPLIPTELERTLGHAWAAALDDPLGRPVRPSSVASRRAPSMTEKLVLGQTSF